MLLLTLLAGAWTYACKGRVKPKKCNWVGYVTHSVFM